MKVIHLIYEDMYGAGRAVRRINKAVQTQGVDSEIYALFTELGSSGHKIKRGVVEQLRGILNIKAGEIKLRKYHVKGAFHPIERGINPKTMDYLKTADIVNLHWVNYGIWSPQLMDYLYDLGIPVVWTLHDMWPFTGGCHVDGGCGKYSEICGCCPILESKKNADISTDSYKIKKRIYRKNKITFIGPSRWITKEANRSGLLSETGCQCINIGNPAPEKEFKVRDHEECRKILGINTNKKIIAFGAVNALSDKNKGYENLKNAIRCLDKDKYMLLIIGSDKNEGFTEIETKAMGFIRSDLHLSMIYNATDAFIAPSFQDTFPNMVMESLACGTPVVAFQIGGMPDMIDQKENGYLAVPYDCKDLANGINDTVIQKWDHDLISDQIRDKYSEKRIGTAYVDLYRSLLIH